MDLYPDQKYVTHHVTYGNIITTTYMIREAKKIFIS